MRKDFKITPYSDINKVLTLLSHGLTKILGDKLIGLYLTGSLTYGDFDHGSSDIDFLAVLDRKLSDMQLREIKEMHGQIGKKIPYWARRLEGSYITKDMLNSIEPPKEARPYVNGGKINHLPHGNEWIINLNALHECSITITGPNPKKIFPKVTMKQLKEASKKDLIEEWLPKLDDSNAFKNPDYDSEHLKTYAILTMCRILYGNKNNSVASKRVASSWVKKTYGKPWSNLVEKAENWKHGAKMDTENKVRNFIQFTYDKLRS